MVNSYNKNIKPRLLPERSFLYFRFPTKDFRKTRDVYIPMLDNCDISESQKSTLGTYELLGRSGNLFAYHGARSRDIKLRFSINLMSIMEYKYSIGLNSVFDLQNTETGQEYEQSRFFQNAIPYRNPKPSFFNLAAVQYAKEIISQLDITPNISTIPGNRTEIQEGPGGLPVKNDKLEFSVNALAYWICILRTSVLNNSKDTSLGPPSIYLSHGLLYKNIPCVCTNVSIKIIDKGGFDVISFTPKVVEVSLDLSENRVGDFGDFNPFDRIQGENLTGWESALEYGTMDNWYESSEDDLLLDSNFYKALNSKE